MTRGLFFRVLCRPLLDALYLHELPQLRPLHPRDIEPLKLLACLVIKNGLRRLSWMRENICVFLDFLSVHYTALDRLNEYLEFLYRLFLSNLFETPHWWMLSPLGAKYVGYQTLLNTHHIFHSEPYSIVILRRTQWQRCQSWCPWPPPPRRRGSGSPVSRSQRASCWVSQWLSVIKSVVTPVIFSRR